MITQGKIETADDAASPALRVSKRIHPEDLNVGDHVAVTETIHQLPTYCWCGLDAYQHPPDELIRLTVRPQDGHQPLKIKSICLPWVLCKTIDGKHIVHDLRQTQLSRLDPGFVAAVHKSYKSDLDKEKKKKGKKKRKKRKSKN